MSVSGQSKLNTKSVEMLAQRNIAPSTLRKCPTRVCVDSVSTTVEKTGEIVNVTTSVDITQYGQLNQNTIASVREILIISVQTRTIIKTFVVIFLVTP